MQDRAALEGDNPFKTVLPIRRRCVDR
jgi:hypothetical protein